jgi:hypothetical protein
VGAGAWVRAVGAGDGQVGIGTGHRVQKLEGKRERGREGEREREGSTRERREHPVLPAHPIPLPATTRLTPSQLPTRLPAGRKTNAQAKAQTARGAAAHGLGRGSGPGPVAHASGGSQGREASHRDQETHMPAGALRVVHCAQQPTARARACACGRVACASGGSEGGCGRRPSAFRFRGRHRAGIARAPFVARVTRADLAIGTALGNSVDALVGVAARGAVRADGEAGGVVPAARVRDGLDATVPVWPGAVVAVALSGRGRRRGGGGRGVEAWRGGQDTGAQERMRCGA